MGGGGAGPGANLLMALFWALVIKAAMLMPESSLAVPMALMGKAGIEINAVLMVLNLLPVPPLDGGRIAVSLLPHRLAYQFSRIEPYGFMILIVLLFTGVFWAYIVPVIIFTIYFIQLFLGV